MDRRSVVQLLGILVIVLLTAGCLTQSISVGMTAENKTDEEQYVWIELKNKNNERIDNHDFLLQPTERQQYNAKLNANAATVLVETNHSTKRVNFSACSPKQITVTITPSEQIQIETNCNKS